MPFESKFDHAEARAMRATGEYTVEEIARHFGVTKGAISQATSGVVVAGEKVGIRGTPKTAAEMVERALPELWTQFKGAKGIAKAKAFDAIVAAAKREQAEGSGEVEPEPLIADVVSGVASLAPERKRAILTAERAHLVAEIEAIDGVLGELVAA